MNAIELSKEYYSEILEPSIREFCPDCLNRIAVGLFGDGSQCLGYDDEVSRDHDWGIRVCILLRRHDYELFANRLRIVISEAPQEYRGYETSWHWLVQRGGVLEILPWFRGLLGDRAIPVKPLDWLSIKEHELLSATNGEI